MKILSFDIGILNLAYCLMSPTNEPQNPIIHDWDIINCINQSPPVHPSCTQLNKNKTKCTCKAHYSSPTEPTQFFCKRHAISTNKNLTPQFPNKSAKKSDLLSRLPSNISQNKTRQELYDIIMKELNETSLIKYTPEKKQSANEADMTEICKSISYNLKERFSALEPTTVIVIEQQLFATNPRMGVIQGMVMQFFTLMYPNNPIYTFSPKWKLKIADQLFNNGISTKTKMGYDENKRCSVDYVSTVIQLTQDWRNFYEIQHKDKQDDLADSLLQAIAASTLN